MSPLLSLLIAFTYNPPGQLESGTEGRVDQHIYVPSMRYPIENAPSFPNSQVYRPGGSRGPGGGQCSATNYQYPWSDNFCEPRGWEMPLCPGGTGHQGQDIRPADCQDKVHWAVAAESGTITSIGSYSVYLVAENGTRHRYLHLDPTSIAVRRGQEVTRGARIGLVSNAYFDADGNPVSTTIHLHYDIHQYVAQLQQAVYVPPYLSLVRSYQELLGQPGVSCEDLPLEGGVVDDTSPCFQRWGPVQYWRAVQGQGVGMGFLWTNAFISDEPSNWARWNLQLAGAGRFRVEVNLVEGYNRSRRVPYRLRHGGQETDVILDQSTASGWRTLGTFDFQAGDDQWISVYDNTGEEGGDLHITVDAIRLTPTAPTQPSADAGVTPSVDAGNQSPADAGQPPSADAGASSQPDAGPAVPAVDAGEAPVVPEKDEPIGCGCTGSGPFEFFTLLTLIGLRRRRR